MGTMRIMQGDQYAIPIKIKIGNEVITPDNCTDIRVKVDDDMISYDSGEGDLKYSETDQTWLFPITEKMSFEYKVDVQVQIAVKIGDDYIYSPIQTINIGHSIIKDRWGR